MATQQLTMKSLKADIYSAYVEVSKQLAAEQEISASYKACAKANVRASEEAQLPHGNYAVFGANTISVWADAVAATKHAKDLEVRYPQGTFTVRKGDFTLSASKKSVQQPAGTHAELVYQTQQ